METIRFEIGSTCVLNGVEFIIDKFITTQKVILRNPANEEIQMAYLRTLTKKETTESRDLVLLDSI